MTLWKRTVPWQIYMHIISKFRRSALSVCPKTKLRLPRSDTDKKYRWGLGAFVIQIYDLISRTIPLMDSMALRHDLQQRIGADRELSNKGPVIRADEQKASGCTGGKEAHGDNGRDPLISVRKSCPD